MRTFQVSLICLLLFIMGCAATVSELRTRPPYQSIESNKPPNELAECILFKADELSPTIGIYHYRKREFPPGTYYISVASSGMPVGEVKIFPHNGGSTVAFSPAWNFWNKKAFWECVQQCATP